MTTLQELLKQWEARSKDALPTHAMLINKHIRELRIALAQQGEQQPVCHGCGIPAGDVHMSTCKSGKWPSRVSNGDTAAPAPQAQQGEQAKPAAYITDTHQGPMVWTPEMYGEACMYCDDDEFPVPLYTQPAQMRILTDEQIKSMWAQYCSYPGGILDFARAIRDVK